MTKQASHVIVFSSNRSGAGQTTAAAHTAIALLRLGYRVGTIDADGDGHGLSLWRDQRRQAGGKLPDPRHHIADGDIALQAAVEDLADCAFIVIDGGPDPKGPAHAVADTLISVVGPAPEDLTLIAYGDTPSPYSLMIEEQSVTRVIAGMTPLQWIVMRNRLPLQQNPADEGVARLATLAGSFGFLPLEGLAERVLLRELMARGLTLLDMKEDRNNSLSVAALAARQDVRTMICAIAPEKIRGPVRPLSSSPA